MSKTWFITGISSGFGHALAEELLARGNRVAGTVRKLDAVDELKRRYPDQLWLARLDVTDTKAINEVVASAFADLGRIDVLVNNAGYGLVGALEELSENQIRHQIDTNLLGSIHVVRAALPFLRNQGSGRVIQLASMGGQVTFPVMSIYHATKWAVEGFVEAVAQEAAPFGIGFTIVEPGMARTNFGGGSLVAATPMEVYERSTAGEVRRAFASGAVPNNGDPRKMARAIIDSVEVTPAPLRLTLGSDAYTMIRSALVNRLSALDAQRAVAESTDVDADAPSLPNATAKMDPQDA